MSDLRVFPDVLEVNKIFIVLSLWCLISALTGESHWALSGFDFFCGRHKEPTKELIPSSVKGAERDKGDRMMADI